jgi:integrase
MNEDNISPNTRSMRFSSLKTFFKLNSLEFNSEIWRIATKTGKKKVIKTVSEEHIPTHEEMTQILSHLSFHNKTVALVLTSSGMRPAEPFALRLDQVEERLNQRPMRIDLEASQTKTAEDRYVFISDEARGALIEWMKYRPQFIKSIENKAKGLNKKKDLSDRVFPFTLSNFRTSWNNALKKAGLYKLSQKTKKKRVTIPPKILRKFFRTSGNWSNPEIAEFLMGHIGGKSGQINRNGNNDLVKVYARYQDTPELVKEVYLEAEPNLTILGNVPEIFELRGQVEELNEVAQTKGEEIIEKSSLVIYMRRDIEQLKNENIQAQKDIADLKEMVLGLNIYIDSIKGQLEPHIASRPIEPAE